MSFIFSSNYFKLTSRPWLELSGAFFASCLGRVHARLTLALRGIYVLEPDNKLQAIRKYKLLSSILATSLDVNNLTVLRENGELLA